MSTTSVTKQRKGSISLSLDWDNIFKKGPTDTRGELLRSIAYSRDTANFCTGSSYEGKWNALGMSAYGNYNYPYGCEYEGGFDDGRFHGKGTLKFPMGQRLDGVWRKGKMVSYTFCNVDGLSHTKDWNYCQMPDRRFAVSTREGLQPAGREFMTNQQPTRPIDPRCYDTGDGFFDPVSKSIIAARDPKDYENLEQDMSEESILYEAESVEKVENTDDGDDEGHDFWVNALMMVSDQKEQWIKEHCRKGWDEPSGYRPDLYEDWITGRKEELDELDNKYNEGLQSSSDAQTTSEQTLIQVSDQHDELILTVQYTGTGRKLLPSS